MAAFYLSLRLPIAVEVLMDAKALPGAGIPRSRLHLSSRWSYTAKFVHKIESTALSRWIC
jgi:hypothetical protein